MVEIKIVGEKDGDGVGYYKNYTIFIADAGEKRGDMLQ